MTEFKNYICIDGRKAELSPEQLKALGIELKKPSPFDRVDGGEKYYTITSCGDVVRDTEYDTNFDNSRFEIANYCSDKALLEQRALHETLNRLLWRYSMEYNGDDLDWILDKSKIRIVYSHGSGVYVPESDQLKRDIGAVYFCSRGVALSAIKEVVEPFMEAHPDFKW